MTGGEMIDTFAWPRNSVITFTSTMEQKLRLNDRIKEPWETTTIHDLLEQLDGEIRELREAAQNYLEVFDTITEQALMLECADVANIAMMIHSKLHPLTRHNRRGFPEHVVPRMDMDCHDTEIENPQERGTS